MKRSTRPSDAARRTSRPRWAAGYFLVTALVVPLVYSTATLDPVLLPRFVLVSFLGIVLATTLGMRILRSAATPTVNRAEGIVLGCLVVYGLVTTLSMMSTGPTPDGSFELLRLATFGWLIYASSRAIDGRPTRLMLLAKFVIVSSFVVGGFAVFQFYQIPLFEWMKHDVTVDSTMAGRNLLASFLVLAFPFVAYAFLEHDGRWRFASGVTLLISFFLLVALQTRSAWVAFPGGLGFSLVVLAAVARRAHKLREPGHAYRKRAIQGLVLAALAFSLAVLVPAPGARAPMREHAGSLVRLRHASIQERLQLWKRTMRMIQEHPFMGVGPGSWRVVVPKYGTEGLRSDTGTLHFQRPHNDPLWVTSETGLLGGALYLALFGSVMAIAVAAMARSGSAHDRVVLMLLLMGVSSYVLVSLFSFPKERPAHSVFLALLIGGVLSFHGRITGHHVWRPGRRWALTLVVPVWIITLVAGRFGLSRYAAELHVRRALEARAVGDWPRMVDHLDRVDQRYYVMDPSSAPVTWYRGVARFEMGDREAGCADFTRALEVHPNHVHVLGNVATCHTLRGEHEDALRAYRRAIEIAPRFEEARVNLGFLLHSLGRDPEAYEVLTPAVEYASSPRFAECFRLVKTALGIED